MNIFELIGYTISSPKAVKMRFEPLFAYKGMRKPAAPDISGCRNILVVKMDRIGDFILSIPFLRSLRSNLPQAKISILTQPVIEPLLDGCPYIDKRHCFAPCNSETSQRYKRYRQSLDFVKDKLWDEKFDYAVVPRWDFDIWHGHYLAYLSGAVRRAGYHENISEIKNSANKDESLFLTDIMKNDVSALHEVQRNLNIISELGMSVVDKDKRIDFWLNDNDERSAAEYFMNKNIDKTSDVIALGHGSWEPRKRWSAKGFADICKWLADKYRCRIIIFGAQEDRESGEEIRKYAGGEVVNAAGEMSLRQVAAVMSRCRLYVGNDTGLKHIAASVNIPVVEICGFSRSGDRKNPLAPDRFKAWTDKGIVVQPDIEGKIDINRVTVDDVKSAVETIMGSRQ